MTGKRDHGGGLDAAIAQYGGARPDWLDLSTGINPVPYPVGEITAEAWTALPDQRAMDRLLSAARNFWNVPEGAEIIAAPGASALIARMPLLTGVHTGGVHNPGPTYNEHAAAFAATGHHWLTDDPADAVAHVYCHPNNPDGRLWDAAAMGGRPLTVIDESFADVAPDRSLIALAKDPGIIVLKSFGKFWGLAGMRLGFAVGKAETLAPMDGERRLTSMAEALGPWAVSGPALQIGARALEDQDWASATRERLTADAARLDGLMSRAGARILGGTTLFRLYDMADAAGAQDHLARHHVWSRIFPYSTTWLRLGLPAPDRWEQLEAALADLPA